MADISPTTQVVLDAVCNNTEPDCDTQHIIAATLRAAVDQPYEVPAYFRGDDYWRFRDGVDAERNRLLAIATELEGVDSRPLDSPYLFDTSTKDQKPPPRLT